MHVCVSFWHSPYTPWHQMPSRTSVRTPKTLIIPSIIACRSTYPPERVSPEGDVHGTRHEAERSARQRVRSARFPDQSDRCSFTGSTEVRLRFGRICHLESIRSGAPDRLTDDNDDDDGGDRTPAASGPAARRERAMRVHLAVRHLDARARNIRTVWRDCRSRTQTNRTVCSDR